MLQNFISSTCPKEVLAEDKTFALMRLDGQSSLSDAVTDVTQNIRVQLLGDEWAPVVHEVWQTDGEVVESGRDGRCLWRRSNSLQMSGYCDDLTADGNIEEAAYEAYKALLEFIAGSPHPELVRFWNYVPNINHGAGDSENYKRFCTGRLQAFSECDFDDLQFPAASAVGHYGQGLTVTALTAASTANHHANPRQIDAFKYPRQYGPSSPSFARATTLGLIDSRMCFISGTASILGHSSVHRGDLKLQLYTTNDNILYLLKETGFKRSQIRTLRVYLRNQSDKRECERIVSELFPQTQAIYLHADICRSDLLVEIECFCVAG